MNVKQVENLLWAAIDEAEKMDIKITAAFVDKGGHLRALLRMDDACWGDIDFATNKAYTAAAWQANSGDFYEDSQPGGDCYGMHFSNGMRVTTFAGGMPVYYEGKLIGAVGISGGSSSQDQRCLNAVGEMLKTL